MAKINLKIEDIKKFHLGGKISLLISKKLKNQKDLSIAYTPGVSKICEEIYANPDFVYSHTSKGHTIAVVTDGTAVLGLGNIGPKASIPVMEGKCMLFKSFANIDAWPVPLTDVFLKNGRTDINKVIETVVRLSPMYGGINLEDIAAPECFVIEEKLNEILDIPVFHDDQWGTAIITLAALKNYLEITGKNASQIKIVINGAGAAGIRIADMIKAYGAKNITMCDSKGTLNIRRNDLNEYKLRHVTRSNEENLVDAMKNADVFIGVSKGNVLTKEMILSMNEYPAIFAMANPTPEIDPDLVKEYLHDKKYILATGRSDYPNQINNVLAFPFIFKGALDVKATKITMNMKIAASNSLSLLAKDPFIPDIVKKAYKRDFKFGSDYLIPTAFDPRIKDFISLAVAKAAIQDGVARKSL
ncbi:MAG: malic enzyme-like NAD(P)-binding protein [Parachlamydiales bacterium]|jgi:malate dehydrogenase (oxaloacetate-decarboxylating)(NADP+)